MHVNGNVTDTFDKLHLLHLSLDLHATFTRMLLSVLLYIQDKS